jgi:hypothetical protein
MIMWIMDPEVFGLPDYGFSVGQSRTFASELGDKGRGLYTSYSPTAPVPARAVYGWNGETLALFRQAWEDKNKLAFGSAWFKVLLPVDLVNGGDDAGLYVAHMTEPFRASLAGHDWWKVSLNMDIDVSPQFITQDPATVPDAPTIDMWTLETAA